MTVPISFTDSNHNTQIFFIIYFKFLEEYYFKEDDMVKCLKKDKSLSDSFVMIKNVILYYQTRNLLINDINMRSDISIENNHNITEFPIALSTKDHSLYRNIDLISDRLLDRIFVPKKYVICTKNSKPSKLWMNTEILKLTSCSN